ncbi:YezD family protein [Halalkalibacterium halodurans]|uniref:BH3126 protein n=1 Tax=Halalkalibacterium halodurans (strain ATCC BAA-125 / DSM 18197 / FERM 7344 / JCM 9153 / C-125) TaxID=272558 RepID=Q9K880_HALH5|nr:YezD family protein [Halalkalibacterium halodurans]MED3645672.1 YezD family protein [Halalkalibacterium halodurans]MED4082109.1 YezD family protein [Halalkalibacterium halodurans]MED4084313.1 YezD family protein [Halalkalibacterium halodurans]MED4103622.1 YezD family protein [Halalkalibacterium halodurans]MED4107589.1 YezD family protein [Halalkalibacterium halodurans]
MAYHDPEKIEEIKKAIEKIKYGSVLITIHEDQIMQIDATERVRFPQNKNKQQPGKSSGQPRTSPSRN